MAFTFAPFWIRVFASSKRPPMENIFTHNQLAGSKVGYTNGVGKIKNNKKNEQNETSLIHFLPHIQFPVENVELIDWVRKMSIW